MIKLYIINRTDEFIEIGLQGVTNCISIYLYDHGLNINVIYQEYGWDMLTSIDVDPLHTPDGYVCRQCRDYPDKPENGGDKATRFPTRYALWEDHLFKPLKNWVNNKLSSAKWLRLSGENNNFTAADLTYDDIPAHKMGDTNSVFIKLRL